MPDDFGMVIAGFTQWLRSTPVSADVTLNLLATEVSVS